MYLNKPYYPYFLRRWSLLFHYSFKEFIPIFLWKGTWKPLGLNLALANLFSTKASTVNVVINFKHYSWLPKDLDKQCRPRSDCFSRSSLIRVFPVCYSDKHFVNNSPNKEQKEKSVQNFRTFTIEIAITCYFYQVNQSHSHINQTMEYNKSYIVNSVLISQLMGLATCRLNTEVSVQTLSLFWNFEQLTSWRHITTRCFCTILVTSELREIKRIMLEMLLSFQLLWVLISMLLR